MVLHSHRCRSVEHAVALIAGDASLSQYALTMGQSRVCHEFRFQAKARAAALQHVAVLWRRQLSECAADSMRAISQ